MQVNKVGIGGWAAARHTRLGQARLCEPNGGAVAVGGILKI